LWWGWASKQLRPLLIKAKKERRSYKPGSSAISLTPKKRCPEAPLLLFSGYVTESSPFGFQPRAGRAVLLRTRSWVWEFTIKNYCPEWLIAILHFLSTVPGME
jgi:hypothetical protein